MVRVRVVFLCKNYEILDQYLDFHNLLSSQMCKFHIVSFSKCLILTLFFNLRITYRLYSAQTPSTEEDQDMQLNTLSVEVLFNYTIWKIESILTRNCETFTDKCATPIRLAVISKCVFIRAAQLIALKSQYGCNLCDKL